MEPYEIRWRSSTKKDLGKLPRELVARVVAAVAQVATEPTPPGSQKLAGSKHTYRIRVGEYRVVYDVLSESRIVEIQRVRHRKDVYRN